MLSRIFFFSALFLSSISFSQIWKPIKNQYQAKYIVYVTNKKEEADIIGFKVDKEYEITKPGMIYLAPIWYSKGTKIYFTDDKSKSDIILYWTSDKKEAKWNK